MNTQNDVDQSIELKKVRQLLAKNIDDFKYLALFNMRLEEKSRPSTEALHLDINRISDYQEKSSESLEDWVSKELAPKTDKKQESSFTDYRSGETLEQWVARQKLKPKVIKKKNSTIIDKIEQWLMNEAKKDLFAEIDAISNNGEGLSSENIRELGLNLISLADKLDRMK